VSRVLAVDVHQHLWPEEVLLLLARREDAPRATWRGEVWEVELPGEPPFAVRPEEHDPIRRAAGLAGAGVDRALVSLSAPVGIESLPPREALAAALLWQQVAATLPTELGWWATVPATLEVADQIALLRSALDTGATGLSLDATRAGCPATVAATLELLAAVEAAGVPVFVHPGPADGDPGFPGWWSPATAYVAQMHAAWHAFGALVRPELPGLRAIFALLAGLAPLHAERTALRGGPAADPLGDPRSFYDTSSYGPRGIRAMAEAVGTGQLVHGTDHPVVTVAGDAVAEALGRDAAAIVRRDGPARALGTEWVPA
jgi:hypothetical protein